MVNINTGNFNDSKRIVITGIGVVSPIGIGKDAFWQGLKEGRDGIKPVTLFDTSTTRSKLAGEITDFKPEAILGPKGLRNLDRTTKLALCAAKLCLDDANFQVTEENADDVGVVLGSTMGSIRSISEFDKEAIRNGPRSVNPALFPNTVINSPASQISIRFGIKGFNTTISGGFTSGLDAMEYARNFILLKRAGAILVGGVEELCEQTFKGFYRLGFLSGSRNGKVEISSPFDKRRNGAVLGEGAAIFLVESMSHAIKRNAHIYGEVKSAGFSFDKNSINKYNVKADGARLAIQRSLERAGVSKESIDYVASSANSTLDGDVSESRALQSALGLEGHKIFASACKSMIGESFSAGAAFQLASLLLTLQDKIMPPTINYKNIDRRCAIDCIPNTYREAKVDTALICCSSPMGQSASLVLAGFSR